jgi:hypothetical protein
MSFEFTTEGVTTHEISTEAYVASSNASAQPICRTASTFGPPSGASRKECKMLGLRRDVNFCPRGIYTSYNAFCSDFRVPTPMLPNASLTHKRISSKQLLFYMETRVIDWDPNAALASWTFSVLELGYQRLLRRIREFSVRGSVCLRLAAVSFESGHWVNASLESTCPKCTIYLALGLSLTTALPAHRNLSIARDLGRRFALNTTVETTLLTCQHGVLLCPVSRFATQVASLRAP